MTIIETSFLNNLTSFKAVTLSSLLLAAGLSKCDKVALITT